MCFHSKWKNLIKKRGDQSRELSYILRFYNESVVLSLIDESVKLTIANLSKSTDFLKTDQIRLYSFPLVELNDSLYN